MHYLTFVLISHFLFSPSPYHFHRVIGLRPSRYLLGTFHNSKNIYIFTFLPVESNTSSTNFSNKLDMEKQLVAVDTSVAHTALSKIPSYCSIIFPTLVTGFK